MTVELQGKTNLPGSTLRRCSLMPTPPVFTMLPKIIRDPAFRDLGKFMIGAIAPRP
jgi:hypothetical protein